MAVPIAAAVIGLVVRGPGGQPPSGRRGDRHQLFAGRQRVRRAVRPAAHAPRLARRPAASRRPEDVAGAGGLGHSRRDPVARGRGRRHRCGWASRARRSSREPRSRACRRTWRWVLAVSGIVAAPALVTPQYIVHNAVAIFFPAWVPAGMQQPRGVDAMGQRLIMMAGVVCSLLLFALPGAHRRRHRVVRLALGCSAQPRWCRQPSSSRWSC